MKEKKRWNDAEREFLLENLDKMTIKELAKTLHRTELAIKLYIHFQRIKKSDCKRNLLLEILTQKFVHPENFRTTRSFFKTVGISQVRFWKLYRGDTPVSEKEYIALIRYFNVDLLDAFEARQLKLFDE